MNCCLMIFRLASFKEWWVKPADLSRRMVPICGAEALSQWGTAEWPMLWRKRILTHRVTSFALIRTQDYPKTGKRKRDTLRTGIALFWLGPGSTSICTDISLQERSLGVSQSKCGSVEPEARNQVSWRIHADHHPNMPEGTRFRNC